MILPIYLFGSEELRRETQEVEGDSEELQRLIDDMIETMHGALGIGLAAPQVGRNERIFVVDVSAMMEDPEEGDLDTTQKQSWPEQPMVFINPAITEFSEEESEFDEGCLSIPDIHENVVRPEEIRMTWLDRQFRPQEAMFDGILSRVIQHEYDHVEGVLFLDHLRPLRRRLLKRKLADIREGIVDADYPVYPQSTTITES